MRCLCVVLGGGGKVGSGSVFRIGRIIRAGSYVE